MQTRTLYYEDAFLRAFRARVLSCQPQGAGFAVILSATAFFPEGGGQSADTGTLGSVRVLDVQRRAGEVVHLTDGPLEPGTEVEGRLDWAERLRKMQDHSGEHIVSGLVHRRFGYANVGFHLGRDGMTMDYDGPLSRAELDALEAEANEVVWRNLPVEAFFPKEEELAALAYRSKAELAEAVRIVRIPGVDVCACCAPHVAFTGQIGLIKLLDFMRHRGGVRIWAKCGADALADYRGRYEAACRISERLSAPQDRIAGAVEKLLEEERGLRRRLAEQEKARMEELAGTLAPTEGDLLLFVQAEEEGLRTLVNAGSGLCGGVCAAFSGTDGEYRFVLGSRQGDVRPLVRRMAQDLGARGGGKAAMAMGTCPASRAAIEAFFKANGQK